MAALRAPVILLSVLVLSALLRTPEARAAEETPEEEVEAAAAAAVTFPDERFGPRYVIDEIQVRGNHKTEKSIIAADLHDGED